MNHRLLVFLIAGAALAQNGSIEGVVVDSVTQSPVRKAQVILMYRGSSQGVTLGPAGTAFNRGGGAGVMIMPNSSGNMIPASRGVGTVASVSSVPMASARMFDPTAAGSQPSAGITDAGGGFAFRDLAPGMYTVRVMHPRYTANSLGRAGTDFEVKSGETARVSVPLTPGASLTGRVVDEDGEPLQGCSVQLRSASSRQVWAGAMGSELSNEKGEYRVYGFQAGSYIAIANCGRPVFQPRPFSAGPPPPPSMGYPAMFYPQTTDVSAATPIEIRAGVERSGVDFQMKPARVYTITGTVSGFDGQSNRHMTVSLGQPGPRALPLANRGGGVNPKTGAFEIQNVFAGSYILTAAQFSPDMSGGTLTARQPVEVADRPVQVHLILQKPVDIPGTFVVEGNPDPQRPQPHLSVTPDDQAGPVPPPRYEPQSDGSFVLRNTSAGRWVLNVYGPGIYLRALEFGGQTLPGNVLDTAAGGAGTVRVFVGTRTAKVEARGTPGTNYAFIRDDDNWRQPQQFVTLADPQGIARLPGLPPGKYGVYEGTMADEAKRLETVTVGEDATVELDLTRRR
jgi:hypothetical protein